jgi:glycosyltransferase involved in cell wall biosynthesis
VKTSSFLDNVAVLILTYNEEANIGRTLAALAVFPEVVVLDSGSTDDTAEIVGRYPNARLVTRVFDNHANQWNHGLGQCGIERPWVLALDADFVLNEAVIRETAALAPDEATSGYRGHFRYCIFGKRLAGTLYPPLVLLYRRARARYIQQGHTQRAVVEGAIAELVARIDHDDRKPLTRWLNSQINYARLEADYVLSSPPSALKRMDRLRRKAWIAPLMALPYVLLVKRCILDGTAGWYYALQRLLAETMIALAILDRKLRAKER